MFGIGPLIVGHGLRSSPRDLRDSATNSPVGPAAANVPAEAVKEIFLRWAGMLVQQSLAGHNKARRSEPALCGIIVDKRLLNWIEISVLGERRHRRDLLSFRLNRKNRARVDDFVFHQ